MRAGQLKQRISIITPGATTRTAEGAPVVTFTTVLQTWAHAEPMSGNEMFRGDYRYTDDTMKFTIRYSTVNIQSKMNIICTGSTYNIMSIVDSSNAHRELILIANRTT